MNMKNFKINDEIWFFYTIKGRKKWYNDSTIVVPKHIGLIPGKIVYADRENDIIHVYVENEEKVVCFDYYFFTEYVFERKQDAIVKMIKSMQEL